MQPEQWQRIQDVFYGALPLEPAQRLDFVSAECSGDSELSDRVLALLREDEDGSIALLDSSLFELGASVIVGQDKLNIGQKFGPYEIRSLIGSGGMGSVYLAEDLRLSRLVALKVLPLLTDAGSLGFDQFQREARAASGVTHPNIAHIYEFSEFDGRHYLAMEYVEGVTLRTLISRGKTDLASVMKIIRQVALALEAAHAKGIVHRDIKPENVIITNDGLVKMLDFGLARRTDPGGAPGENSFSAAGTVSYMSPEQINGAAIDQRTDIWSLGVVFYEMVCGSRPFTGPGTSEILKAVLSNTPTLTDCEPRIATILVKCLQKDRDSRYASAKQVIDDLVEVGTDVRTEKQRWWPWVISGLFLVALLVFGYSYSRRPAAAAPAPRTVSSIAVLPFKNASASRDKDYLAYGIAEALITRMSQVQNLTVKGGSSSFQYKDQQIDPEKVGGELGVQALLTGNVSENTKTLTLDLDLVDTATGESIWRQKYERPTSELMRLQNDIAVDVAEKLRGTLSPPDQSRLEKTYTQNSEAYADYMIGRYFWSKRTGAEMERSIEEFQSAVKLDPNFALAYAGMADSYVLLPSYKGTLPPEVAFPKAKAAAMKALELDESLAEAHTALSFELFNYEWDFLESEKHFGRALVLNPNYATAYHWYGNANLLAYGHFDESIDAMKRARELDPLSLIINADLGTSYCYALRLDEAIDQFNKTLEMDPDFYYAHVYLGRTYLLKGEYERALDELQQASVLSEDPRIPMRGRGYIQR